MATDWHKMEEQEILDHFTVESAEKGIPQFRVAAIQRKFGENLITPMHKPGIWEYLGSQISVLISTAIIAGCFAGTVYVHESSTSFIIHMILCVLMFVYPIYSAFKSKNHDTEFANSDLIIPKTHVVRDSSMQQISSVDLVPGDIISFGAGEKVPADIRILTADKLLIDEGILTGVSDPKKCDAEVSKENLIQPTNMAWCGCTITGGSGSGIVVATGKNIKLASQEQNLAYNRLPVSEAKDLVENSVYGIVFGILSLVLLVIALLWSIDDGYDPFGKIAFLLCITCFSLSRNIANMPQQFYEFLLAAYRAQGILIKSGKTLTAISDVNVVVSELKDVLTPNEISFSRVWQNGKIVHRAGDQVVRLLALVIDEFAQTPVEKALIDMIERRADMSQIKQENKQIQTIPTEEELKSSATLNLVDNKRMLIVLGPSDKMSSK